MKLRSQITLLLIALSITAAAQTTIWKIGEADNNSAGFALSPNNEYKRFLEHDFGWEDRFYLVGHSKPGKDFPYCLPGPKDAWGGTAPTSGIRSHLLNVLFGVNDMPAGGKFTLVIDLAGYNGQNAPIFKVEVNGQAWTQQLPKTDVPSILTGPKEHLITINLPDGLIRKGGNEVKLTSLDGSWVMFDQVRLEGPSGVVLTQPAAAHIREIKAAGYEITVEGRRAQPLLVDVEHLSGTPALSVKLDGVTIFSQKLETNRYQFEVPMPTVKSAKNSRYEVFLDGALLNSGTVSRNVQRLVTPADYVDTRIGTAHSRWMIAPGPWMPFSMVKLSPDNQNDGWQAGYDPTFESIGAFSHIHEWTLGGLGVLPVNGTLKTKVGDQRAVPGTGYRSQIDKSTEEAPLGYYKVVLKDYNIKAELTATTRASFMRYTYPKATDSRIMIDLQTPAENYYSMPELSITKVSDYRIEGYTKQSAAGVWFDIPNDYIVHFVMEFDQPIKKYGTWVNDKVGSGNLIKIENAKDAGAFVEFDTRENQVVQVRTGISYVSIAGAAANLNQEIEKPFGWDFEKVRQNQQNVWNELFNRVTISSDDRREKMRFYSNMYRAICSRNIFSDVDGKWVDATEKVQQLANKNDLALGCDAFWNTFWNLNQFWNLVTPEWSSKWVRSQLAMYDANGWLAKGPAGMEYIPVMVAEHEVPLVVSAYQMGIRDFDVQKAYKASLKTLNTPAENIGGGVAGNPDFNVYKQYKYVPFDKGRFSNTLEFSYDDWTLSQFAKALNKTADHQEFADRGTWWKNAIDTETGYARMRHSDGSWSKDFDPFKSGANHHYVEGNAWQLTFFVPQDVPGLANTIGLQKFKDRLAWGFEESEKWRFNAPNDQYWDYPVIQGNQQSMHFAFLFNWVKEPWNTQRYSRSIIDRYYGYDLANAYLGDEDQGQMSAWYIMAAIGLFQIDGGARVDPIYEIASPIFPKVTINLGQKYGRGKSFTIAAKNVSRQNKYVQGATLNGKKINTFWFPASELLKGGSLVLEMGAAPNKNWGIAGDAPVSK